MSVIAEISIDWSVSPRIITVGQPVTEATCQDIYDTCRFLEASSEAMDNPTIITAAGKEELGGGTSVGLTVTLLDALVAFEARLGPEYVQCSVSGGNLVAVDNIGAYFTTPIYPTAFTQVVTTASSSATSANNAAIEYGSFNGGITFDQVNGSLGTEYPIGTPQEPVKLIEDAKIIATARGLTTGYIKGDLTFDITSDVDSFIFIGSSKSNTTVTIPDAANVSNCTFYDSQVTGVLDGQSALSDCLITDLEYINGYVESCVLDGVGTITLGGGGTSHFLSCYSGIPGTDTPTIDMGGAGQALAMRNYNGGILLTNKTGPEAVSIDLGSGQVKVDLLGNFGTSGVTNGSLVIRGDGKVIEATTGDYLPSGDYNGVTILNETVGINSFSSGKYGGKVYIDSSSGITGLSDPYGLITYPVNNLTDAEVILNKYNLNEYHFHSNYIIPSGFNLEGYTVSAHNDILTFTSGSLTDSIIVDNTIVTGFMSGDNQAYTKCTLNSVSGLSGRVVESIIGGTLNLSGYTLFKDCIAPQSNPVTLNVNGNTCNMPEVRGYISIANTNGGSASVSLRGGQLTIEPSCTTGIINVDNVGTGTIVDNSGGATVVIKELTNDSIMASEVEANLSVQEALKIVVAACGGKISGAGTGDIVIRDIADTKDVITATTDANGNRLTVSTDVS